MLKNHIELFEKKISCGVGVLWKLRHYFTDKTLIMLYRSGVQLFLATRIVCGCCKIMQLEPLMV